ncbi:MAG: Wzz/FepE/Etk N-terminal domain-containing protein [Bacteroidetes bacterium]|nr:Wzz/FepE/Etk N-terminal domain-containing protein [Bacteroidota bacterium]
METPENTSPETERVAKSNFLNFLDKLLRWRRFLFVLIVAVMIVTVVIVLLIPRYYKAEASVLPPQGGGLMGLSAGLSSMLGSISPMLLKGTGLSGVGSSMTFLAILNSRTVAEDVINKFDLVKVYKIKRDTIYNAIKELRQNTNFDVDENNAIVITVYDKSSERAAGMANYFVTRLNDIYIRMSIEEAHNQRVFLEKRYRQNLSDLRASEDSLRDFQEKYKVYSLPEQTKAAISAGADLQAQAISKEVELGVLQNQFGSQAPQVALVRLQIQEIEKQLRDMETGNMPDTKGVVSLLPAFNQVPELGVAYLRLYRNVEIQTKLLEILMPMYEQAKIDEQKSIPAVYVLDQAIPPERPSTPKRVFIVVLVFIFLLAFLVYIIYLFERVGNEAAPSTMLEGRLKNMALWSVRKFKVKGAIRNTED